MTMKYENVKIGFFVERENRFVARVNIDGEEQKVHVKNTGRCRELLIPGATVYLEDFRGRMGTRKMRYSLICVDKAVDGNIIRINMDSQAPNAVMKEALENGTVKLPGMEKLNVIKAEQKYGSSRFDFYVESEGKKGFVEVKGVTLEKNGIAMFPDAPTERGIKHLNELGNAAESGFNAYAVFVIQMSGMKEFIPNRETHPEFAKALRYNMNRGVKILIYECDVRKDELCIKNTCKVKLGRV